MQALGVDVSGVVVKLARTNLRAAIAQSPTLRKADVSFVRGDVLATHVSHSTNRVGSHDSEPVRTSPTNSHLHIQRKRRPTFSRSKLRPSDPAPPLHDLLSEQKSDFDILIANPPYISSAFRDGTTARSVRAFEPRSALVPPHDHGRVNDSTEKDTSGEGDMFYRPLLQHAVAVNAKVVLLEVGDMAQAVRVARLALKMLDVDNIQGGERMWKGVEIWGDGVGDEGEAVLSEDTEVMKERNSQGQSQHLRIPMLGCGQDADGLRGRAIMCWKGSGSLKSQQ